MSNVAQDLLWPSSTDVLVRAVFLYVGQGESTILLVADNASYQLVLVDIHSDVTNGGIDVPRLIKDLMVHKVTSLHAFVNTHPHNDHLCGVARLADTVSIDEVWHSGHNPGKDHRDAYDELQTVIRDVKKRGGREVRLFGSRTPNPLGEAEYYVLAPAEYVSDDIAEESSEQRYRRVHEQCAVIRVGLNSSWIMLTGDADRDAWEKHIAAYHKERLPAGVLSAAHHGSRTFFRYDEADDPYLEALEIIDPDYVIVSAPKRSESRFDHPHKDAMKQYADQVGPDNVLHTGERRYSFICDIFRDGAFQIDDDNGELARSYASEDGDAGDRGGNGGKGKAAMAPAVVVTRVDRRPMGDF